MSTSTREPEAFTELSCSQCTCGIDCCAFCDESGCPAAVCYGCLIVELGETAAQPHEHGG